MKTNEIILYGAIGLGAYLLLSQNSSQPVTYIPGTTTPMVPQPASNPLSSLLSLPSSLLSIIPNSAPGVTPATGTAIPPPPATFDINYYLLYQYPVMLAQRPDIGNPNYIMADPAAMQYIANYADLQGANLQSWPGGLNTAGQHVSHKQGTDGILDKARLHWQQYAVPQKRSFLPFTPMNNSPQVGVPIPPVPVAKSNGGFLGGLASIVSAAVPIITALAGPGEDELLTAEEVEVVVTGGSIILETLPLFFVSPANGKSAIEMYNNFENLIGQYV